MTPYFLCLHLMLFIPVGSTGTSVALHYLRIGHGQCFTAAREHVYYLVTLRFEKVRLVYLTAGGGPVLSYMACSTAAVVLSKGPWYGYVKPIGIVFADEHKHHVDDLSCFRFLGSRNFLSYFCFNSTVCRLDSLNIQPTPLRHCGIYTALCWTRYRGILLNGLKGDFFSCLVIGQERYRSCGEVSS